MTIGAESAIPFGRLIERAGHNPQQCGFWILQAVDRRPEAAELLAYYLAHRSASLFALWLLPPPERYDEVAAVADFCDMPLSAVGLLLEWPRQQVLLDDQPVTLEPWQRN